jgi:hypothetical protein
MKVDFIANNSWKQSSQKLHRVILLQTVGEKEKKKTFIQRNAQLDVFSFVPDTVGKHSFTRLTPFSSQALRCC